MLARLPDHIKSLVYEDSSRSRTNIKEKPASIGIPMVNY